MKRRTFIERVGRGALGAGLLGGPVLSGCARGDGESTAGTARTDGGTGPSDFSGWTWVHGNADRTPEEWAARFGQLADAGFRGVLVSGGDTGVLADAAHGAGLEFHRWMWILNRNGDTFAMENHPEWFTVSRNGESTLDAPPYVGYYRWVCPSRAPVRDYLNGLLGEVAADPRVDGVHLDYIRYCDVILPRGLWETYDLVQDTELPEFDFCYCDVCREQFREAHGRDPMELEDAPSDEEWVRFRWDSVTRLVNEIADTVHGHDKILSAAVFPGPSVARRLVRQSWDEWQLDLVFPMLYHSFYLEDIDWIGEMVAEGVEATRDGAVFRSGLYLPALDPAQLEEAISVSRRNGASGFSTFEMNGLSDEHLAAIRRALE